MSAKGNTRRSGQEVTTTRERALDLSKPWSETQLRNALRRGDCDLDNLSDALRLFQSKCGLKMTGRQNQATRQRLVSLDYSKPWSEKQLWNALQQFGYYQDKVSDALGLFQAMHGLKVTGEQDQATRQQLAEPTCGLPDFVRKRGEPPQYPPIPIQPKSSDKTTRDEAHADSEAPIQTTYKDYAWPNPRKLTYTFVDDPKHKWSDPEKVVVGAAFATFQAAFTPGKGIIFVEVFAVPADIFIAKKPNDTDCNQSGLQAAHSDYPIGFVARCASKADPIALDFNRWKSWGVPGASPNPTAFDLQSIALHEIGHILGFVDHSIYPTSVMYNDDLTGRVVHSLSAEDQSRLNALYP